MSRTILLSLLFAAGAVRLAAADLPAGAEIHVRLAGKIAAATAKPGDPVEFTVIAPVIAADEVAIPQGARIRGKVKAAQASAKPDERATLVFDFTDVVFPGGAKTPVAAKLVEVDNAREKVDEKGQIIGILETETLSAKMDASLEKLAEKWGTFGGILQAAKGAVIKKADVQIVYEAGTEMDLALTAPLKRGAKFDAPRVASIEPADELAGLVNSQPFQTMAQKPRKPSDITSIMYLGSKEQVEAAFKEAGWYTAEQLNAKSGIETVAAVAENRGYKEAPMSILLLDDNPPDIVFQKQLNTFAKRHHLRIFKRPDTFHGREVWVCAATHDIGISFSPENRTFIHLIDHSIDKERAKVVTDLLLTGLVKGLALVERPAVPAKSMNATGDAIETDAKMAVLLLD